MSGHWMTWGKRTQLPSELEHGQRASCTAAMQPGHRSSSTVHGSDWLRTVPTSRQAARARILSLQTGMATGLSQPS